MRLTGRVKTLERRGATAAVCGVCRGRGYPSVSMWFAEEPKPVPRGCHGCGVCNVHKLIVIDERRGEKWGPPREAAAPP